MLLYAKNFFCFFFSSRRRHTRCHGDWSSDVCSSDLRGGAVLPCAVGNAVGHAGDRDGPHTTRELGRGRHARGRESSPARRELVWRPVAHAVSSAGGSAKRETGGEGTTLNASARVRECATARVRDYASPRWRRAN